MKNISICLLLITLMTSHTFGASSSRALPAPPPEKLSLQLVERLRNKSHIDEIEAVQLELRTNKPAQLLGITHDLEQIYNNIHTILTELPTQLTEAFHNGTQAQVLQSAQDNISKHTDTYETLYKKIKQDFLDSKSSARTMAIRRKPLPKAPSSRRSHTTTVPRPLPAIPRPLPPIPSSSSQAHI